MTGRTVVIGVDFGSESARAIVVDAQDGTQLATASKSYHHGVLDRHLPTGEPLGPNWALQHPSDYLDSLCASVRSALTASGADPAGVIGIGTDFTACTVLPARADGTPLCLLDGYASEPHAWVKLWKHHAAQPHADRINQLAEARDEQWRHRYGGKQSAEWQLAKALQLHEEAPQVFAAMDAWVEAADWIVWQLTGTLTRSAALAGYKAARQDDALPSADFLDALSPGFSALRRKSGGDFATLGDPAGQLEPDMAQRLGLTPGIAVCVGNVDAHVAAPAAQALTPGRLLAVMGTSTCHILNGTEPARVEGICGVVRDGVAPGSWGFEAGQSGVGDIFGWATRTMAPISLTESAAASGRTVHEILTDQAEQLGVGESGLLAIDWLSGNRSILVDHELSGVIIGLTLATEPHHIYRSLLEATVFGTRMIIESFDSAGVGVDDIVATGGLVKNRLLMQLTADITGRPVRLARSKEGPAFGSAIHAAVAAGAHSDIFAATHAMVDEPELAYLPNERRSIDYEPLFREYSELHDLFGRERRTMKQLLAGRTTAGHAS